MDSPDDADSVLDELLGASDTAVHTAPAAASPPSDAADAILDDLLGESTGEPDAAPAAPVGDQADADALLDELMGDSAAPAPAGPLDTTDEILGDLLADEPPAAPSEAEPAMDFGGDEDDLLNDLLGESGIDAADQDAIPSQEASDDILEDLMGAEEAPAVAAEAPTAIGEELEGLESLEDIFDLGEDSITEKAPEPAVDDDLPPLAEMGMGMEMQEEIPLLSDVVIPGEQLAHQAAASAQAAPPGAPSPSGAPPASSPLSADQYETLLNDLAGELQVRLAWRIEQQLKGAMDQLVHDALEQAAADLKESIHSQLKESLPSVLDRLGGK